MAGGCFTKAKFALRCVMSLVLYIRQFWVLMCRWLFSCPSWLPSHGAWILGRFPVSEWGNIWLCSDVRE